MSSITMISIMPQPLYWNNKNHRISSLISWLSASGGVLQMIVYRSSIILTHSLNSYLFMSLFPTFLFPLHDIMYIFKLFIYYPETG